jgi:hypothetical protein
MFDIRTHPDYIAIVDREGVGTDITPLIAFAAAPRTELDPDEQDLRLVRPPTRILVVTDAEGPMATPRDRERKRSNWVDRLVRTLPRGDRTETAREALDVLVHVESWGRRGASFEFAHFTDRELAKALASLEEEPSRLALSDRTSRVASVRAAGGNLKVLLPEGRSKLELADALWPLLEAKIRRAERRGTEASIPIVRVLDRATDLAREFPRGALLIPLDGERSDER